MDEDQQCALETVINGHNLLLTGQAGTGKSFVVKNIIKKLNSRFCVTASTGLAHWFKDAFPHVINLKIIHRQDETDLINVINEMEQGLPSPHTVAFLNSLSRPLSAERTLSAVHLFARNIDVMLFNQKKLHSVVGDLHTFKSEDSGESKLCDQFFAPKYFGVKIGCPVMLLINLTDHLVNGKIGTVKLIEDEFIHVTFCLFGESRTVKISKFTFSKFDPVSKSSIASRRQFPLNLAYAFTIHKSQGMTIQNLVVDCSNAVYPGQIGVAIGRAQTTDGLCVKNFKPTLCRAHPAAVQHFYVQCRYGEIRHDCTCCNKKKRQDGKDENDDHDDEGDDKDDDNGDDDNIEGDGCQGDESDLSDFEYDIVKEIEVQEKSANKTEELMEVLSFIMEEFQDTPLCNDAAEVQHEILLTPSPFIEGFHKHKTEVENIGSL
ncbi:ATP-dependent DNA helicase PIF1-like [Saccostrea cucullata]|uniref:ATP-dependent DNA helicase PIF1-like n=1 Tax=Saccostrea cuccullata TaxID=36930 RepID=UPI002ED2A940